MQLEVRAIELGYDKNMALCDRQVWADGRQNGKERSAARSIVKVC